MHLQSNMNGISKADCIAHALSSMSVDDSHTLLFITTYILQFYNTANITRQMPDQF
jgi:hypothetical protein